MFQPPAMLQSFEAKELSAELCLDLSDVSVGQDTSSRHRVGLEAEQGCLENLYVIL